MENYRNSRGWGCRTSTRRNGNSRGGEGGGMELHILILVELHKFILMFECSLSYPCFFIIFIDWRYLRRNRISTIADGTFTRLKYLSRLWVDFVNSSLLDTCTQFSICTQYELKKNKSCKWMELNQGMNYS